MSTVLGRSLALAFGGLVAGLGLVLALFGGDLRERWAPAHDAAAPRNLASPAPQAPGGGAVAALPETPAPERPAASASPPLPGLAPSAEAPAKEAAKEAAKPDPATPSFDVVRVEPNGESVVAGRGRPDSTVELLVDGKPVAKAQTDRDGQFAIVPPRLPPGSSEIVLRSTASDGREVRSKQSVAVALPASGASKPLVALTAPDSPTRVLSQPEPAAETREGAPPAKPTPLRIVSVDAQENGRLFVSSEAPPGAAVRLYLNDTLIAPARAGADGKVTFTIGKGVRPGAYRVRVDQVDPESGKVRIRAEVPLTVPEPTVQVAARTAPAPGRAAVDPGAAKPAPARTEAAKPDAAAPEARRAEPENPEAKGLEAKEPGAKGPEAKGPEAKGPEPRNAAAVRPGAQAARPEPRPEPAQPREQSRPPNAAGSVAQAQRETGQAQREAGNGIAPPAPGAAPAETARSGPAAAAPGQSAASGHAAVPTRPAEPAAPSAHTADAAPGFGAAQAPGSVFVPEINTARIERGNSLWQISRRTYGRGNRYTVIYDANQDQIRDPDLIYPGQIFVLPEDKDGAGGRKRG